jgi:hypothetical protein
MEKQKVDVILESSINNLVKVPGMISSSDFYRIKKQGDDIIVEYHQECQLTKSSITALLLGTLKNEAIHFMKKLFEYLNTICGGNPIIDQQYYTFILSRFIRPLPIKSGADYTFS